MYNTRARYETWCTFGRVKTEFVRLQIKERKPWLQTWSNACAIKKHTSCSFGSTSPET